MLFMMMFACVDKTTDTGIQETEFEYYTASTIITLEESGMEFEEGYLVRRTLDPSVDEIFEEFYSTIDDYCIKIPSGEITNLPYLRHIAAFGKPLMRRISIPRARKSFAKI